MQNKYNKTISRHVKYIHRIDAYKKKKKKDCAEINYDIFYKRRREAWKEETLNYHPRRNGRKPSTNQTNTGNVSIATLKSLIRDGVALMRAFRAHSCHI